MLPPPLPPWLTFRYNTRWALELLPKIKDTPGDGVQTRLVTVFFGANDASLPEANPRQHVPIAEYVTNLKAIVASIRSACPAAQVLLITPPPIDEGVLNAESSRLKGSRSNAVAGEYAAACVAAAAEVGAPCVDLWTGFQQRGGSAAEGSAADQDRSSSSSSGGSDQQAVGWQGLLCDGLHLSTAGNKAVAEAVLACVDANFDTLKVTPCKFSGSFGNSGSASELPPDGPWHDQILTPEGAARAFEAHPAHNR